MPTPPKKPSFYDKLLIEIKPEKWTILKGLLLIVAIPPLSVATLPNSGLPLLSSAIVKLLLLISLMTGIVKIARLRPTGWLWLGVFCYVNAFGVSGITAWVYLILSGLACAVYYNWKKYALGK